MKLFSGKNSRQFGQNIEQSVAEFLQQRGLKPYANNFNCKMGEIDLIMKDGQCLVFIEVRFRSYSNYGQGIETVTKNKQNKLTKAALIFLQKHDLMNKVTCRFDVVGVTRKNTAHLDYQWIRNAFMATTTF